MNDQELTHIDLFSGIGGFSLAGEWAGFRTVVFCEKEPFCQEVLKEKFGAFIADSEHTWELQSKRGKQKQWRRIGNISLIPDIRDFDGTKWRGATLLTGGFPCQPFSHVGKRKGKKDDRYLWPQMFRIIKEAKPRWILAENVTGIVKLALGQVLSDLESIGYDFPRDHEGTPIVPIIPACGLNAPHRRYRVWVIANSTSNGGQELFRNMGEAKRQESQTGHKSSKESLNPDSHAPDSQGRMPGQQTEQERGQDSGRGNSYAPDSDSRGNRRYESEGIKKGSITCSSWQEDWYEVAARFCRVDDGLPSWIHSDRVKRLKALGNAIVPQIAYEIMKSIAWIENE